MELRLAKVIKNNKKEFYRHIDHKRKAKESVPPLIKKKGELVMTDMEKDGRLRYSTSLPQSSLVVRLPKSFDFLNL